MMTKPPGFASSSTLPLEDEEEESIDDSLEEILLEANEKPQENSVKSLEAVPSSLEESESEIDEDADVIESSPISAGGAARTASPPSEITVIAPRPTFADDEVKEETKVDPYETAIRAAATRDDGLTSQASHQRERALRKTANTPVRVPARAALAEVEFEEAETGNEDAYDSAPHGGHSERTPADIPIADESSGPSPAGGYATASGGYMPRLPPPGRPMPPPGRPDIYPGRRIPTPNSDFLPSPSSGFGSGAHYPSIAIPAPSAHDSSTRTATSRGDNRVRLPAAGLAMFLVTAFGGGLLVGAMLWRGRAPSGPVDLPVVTHVVSKPIVAEPVQPIVKPVPSPSSVTAAAAPAPSAGAANPGTAAPTMPTLAAETAPVVTEMPPPVEKPKKSKSRKTTTLDEDLAAAANEPPPPPTRSRKKKTIPWQDPFAQ
jgi:hypothetical protein